MPETESVESRIHSLERTCKLLAAALVALAAALLFVAAAPGEPDGGASPLSAGAFRLVDAGGAVVAELKVGEDGPGLFLYDAEGRERVALVHQAEQTGLFIKDAAGDARIGVAQFAHGGGGVALHGEGMKGAAVLYLKGKGSLSFYDGEGNVSLRLPASEEARRGVGSGATGSGGAR